MDAACVCLRVSRKKKAEARARHTTARGEERERAISPTNRALIHSFFFSLFAYCAPLTHCTRTHSTSLSLFPQAKVASKAGSKFDPCSSFPASCPVCLPHGCMPAPMPQQQLLPPSCCRCCCVSTRERLSLSLTTPSLQALPLPQQLSH